MLSASTDGLISISNPDERDEDEANIYVANWGCSVSKVGWIKKVSHYDVWATSDMETLSFWSHDVGIKCLRYTLIIDECIVA